eukprot:scaffold22124_cov22-Prasinocladus_malaysianus.AAC.2
MVRAVALVRVVVATGGSLVATRTRTMTGTALRSHYAKSRAKRQTPFPAGQTDAKCPSTIPCWSPGLAVTLQLAAFAGARSATGPRTVARNFRIVDIRPLDMTTRGVNCFINPHSDKDYSCRNEQQCSGTDDLTA